MWNFIALSLIVSSTYGRTDMAESTRLVILIKNIYTLWEIYFIMEYQNTPYPTSHED